MTSSQNKKRGNLATEGICRHGARASLVGFSFHAWMYISGMQLSGESVNPRKLDFVVRRSVTSIRYWNLKDILT